MQKETKSKVRRAVKSYPVLIQYKNECEPDGLECKHKNVRIFAVGDKAEKMGLDDVHIEFGLPKARIVSLHAWFSIHVEEQGIPIIIMTNKEFGSFNINIYQEIHTINRPYYKVWGYKNDIVALKEGRYMNNIVVLKEGNVKIPNGSDEYVYAILTPKYDISITMLRDGSATVMIYDRKPPLPHRDPLLEIIRQKLSLQ